MAIIYVRSTDGDDLSNGSTWLLAKATVAGALAIAAAGDTIYVSQAHAENVAAGITWNSPGTGTLLVKIICANDAAEPPTTVAETATITCTGTNSFIANGAIAGYGLDISSGSSTGASTLQLDVLAGYKQLWRKCKFRIPGSNVNSRIAIGSATTDSAANAGHVQWIDCDTSFGNASQTHQVNNAWFTWQGGSILVGSAAITSLIFTGPTGRPGSFEISGVDFSNAATAVALTGTNGNNYRGVFANCKLPASWSGNTGTHSVNGSRVMMDNCDAGSTNYRMWVGEYLGDIKSETTVVRTGGASDGTTPLSWRIDSGTRPGWPGNILKSPPISIWNDTTGVVKTVTAEIVHDTNVAAGQGSGTSFAFTDDEVWIEVEYMGDAGSPKSTRIDDAKASWLAAATDQTSSTVAWTTTGLTTPVKQKLVSPNFTPQQKGYIQVRICTTVPSKTFYVCPKVTVA